LDRKILDWRPDVEILECLRLDRLCRACKQKTISATDSTFTINKCYSYSTYTCTVIMEFSIKISKTIRTSTFVRLTLSEIRDTVIGVAAVIQARRAPVQDTVWSVVACQINAT